MSSEPKRAPLGGATLVVGATIIAGIGGYAITTLIARGLGEFYGGFAVFWSSLYLVIGALAGIQQEITRGMTVNPSLATTSKRASVGVLGILFSATVLGIVSIVGAVWGSTLFGANQSIFVLPWIVGATLNVFVAAITGVMYGIHAWKPLAAIIIGDVAIRFALIATGLGLGADMETLAWATVLPFPILAGLSWLALRKALARNSRVDIRYAVAWANTGRTVLASLGSAVLVSGFPLAIALSSTDATMTALSAVVFALTLTRAPLVVGSLALQSYLIISFRDGLIAPLTKMMRLCGAVLAGGIVLGLLAYAWAAPVIVALAGTVFSLSPGFIALLTLSSVPTAWLAITGAAVLARSRHTVYSAGWVVGALAGVAILFLPGDLETRVLLSLSFGPLAGMVIHLIPFVGRRLPRTTSSRGPRGQ